MGGGGLAERLSNGESKHLPAYAANSWRRDSAAAWQIGSDADVFVYFSLALSSPLVSKSTIGPLFDFLMFSIRMYLCRSIAE